MSQRESGYARKERDSYETPAWVTAALVPHLPVTNGKVMTWSHDQNAWQKSALSRRDAPRGVT
jgi:hypothetical protein